MSNSAGTRLDAGGIQACFLFFTFNSVVILVSGGISILPPPSSRPPPQNIQACLLVHFSYPNLLLIHFIRYQDEELVIVGDRIFTDVVMANRMRKSCESSSKGILGTTLSCAFEKSGTVATEKETSHINLRDRWRSGLAFGRKSQRSCVGSSAV